MRLLNQLTKVCLSIDSVDQRGVTVFNRMCETVRAISDVLVESLTKEDSLLDSKSVCCLETKRPVAVSSWPTFDRCRNINVFHYLVTF